MLKNLLWEPLKTGVKSKNGQGVPASRKADEVRLYALRGGFLKQAVCYTHFHSNKVFRGDLILNIISKPPFYHINQRYNAKLGYYYVMETSKSRCKKHKWA